MFGKRPPEFLTGLQSHQGFSQDWSTPADKTDACWTHWTFSYVYMCLHVGVGCVCVCCKERMSLWKKGGICKTQATPWVDGMRSQETSPTAPDSASFHVGEATDFLCHLFRSLSPRKASQQASTSWCTWVRKLSLGTTPGWWHGFSRQAQAQCCLNCPPTKTHTPRPSPPMSTAFSFFHSELYRKPGTLLISLRCKQDCISCQNLCKIPMDLRITWKKFKRQRKKLGNTETSFRTRGWIRNLGRSCVIIFIFFIERRWECLCSETFRDCFQQSGPESDSHKASQSPVYKRKGYLLVQCKVRVPQMI